MVGMTQRFLSMSRRWFSMLMLAGALLALGTPAQAQTGPRTAPSAQSRAPVSRPAANSKARVEVMVVHATNGGTQVDPRLRDLQRQLDQMRFTGFSVLTTDTDGIAPGQVVTMNVAGGRKLKLRLISKDARQARVRIELFKGSDKKLDTTVSIPRNRTFVVGGPKFQEGVLIFPITVKY